MAPIVELQGQGEGGQVSVTMQRQHTQKKTIVMVSNQFLRGAIFYTVTCGSRSMSSSLT